MPSPVRLTLAAVALLAACTPKEPAPAADTTAAAAPAPAAPRAIVTVLYQWPKDTAAFEAYYPKHLEIVSAAQAEIGFTKAELTRFTMSLQGAKPAFYRQAELYFPSLEAAKAGMATAGFKRVGDDLANFATGGLIGMVAEETGEASEAACPVLATVVYDQPLDSAAFEAYYPKHLAIVTAGAAEIGFTRADLTKFVSNLDGTPAAKYRQAELCFPSLEAATKGIGTAAFGKVGNDFPNFATGGLVGMLGVATN